MRVLHLYSGNLYGGVESLLVTLASHRAACPEMETHFGLCFEGRLGEELRTAGAPVHVLGSVRLRSPLTVWRARRALRALLRRARFDAVVCHSAWPQAVFGPAVRAAGVPLVLWLHDRVDPRHWLQRLARGSRPALVVCNSRYTAQSLPGAYPGVPGEVVYCPVAPPVPVDREAARRRVRAELDTPEGAVVIVQASRMEAWKGHALHLQALARLGGRGDWVCWMVGGAQRDAEAAYLRGLVDEADRLGIAGRIRWVGQRRDVPRLLAAADLHCQPNTGPEPFGIAFVEALFAGLPSVTTAIGGAREIVDDTCGALVPPADPDALAATLGELVGSPERRALKGAAGPARARELCDPAVQLPRLHRLLAGVAPARLAGSVPPGLAAGVTGGVLPAS
jgi:glycosyltransferase involved in cell wall biosynthesis